MHKNNNGEVESQKKQQQKNRQKKRGGAKMSVKNEELNELEYSFGCTVHNTRMQFHSLWFCGCKCVLQKGKTFKQLKKEDANISERIPNWTGYSKFQKSREKIHTHWAERQHTVLRSEFDIMKKSKHTIPPTTTTVMIMLMVRRVLSLYLFQYQNPKKNANWYGNGFRSLQYINIYSHCTFPCFGLKMVSKRQDLAF